MSKPESQPAPAADAALDPLTCPLPGTTLIEASAGTGKTWNICALVLRLLLEQKLDVARILVVTFTNAATAELRARIRDRVAQALKVALEVEAGQAGGAPDAGDRFVHELIARLLLAGDTPSHIVLRLRAALASFDEAAIFTIHSFCQRALGDVPFASGVPLHLSLTTDDTELVLQVVHDFWRRRLTSANAGLVEQASKSAPLSPGLSSYLIARQDTPEKWAKTLRQAISKPRSNLLWPLEIDTPSATPQQMSAVQQQFDTVRTLWWLQRERIEDIAFEAIDRLNQQYYKPHALKAAFTQWDELLRHPYAGIANFADKRLSLLGSHRFKAKGKLQPPQPHPFFDEAQALLNMHKDIEQRCEMERLRLLRELLTDGPAQLRELKRQRQILAFDDMLSDLHTRISNGAWPSLIASLRHRFSAALVDEFQDTDPVQFDIFHAVYAQTELPLFLVGDPKQAIYSFRNADLHTYLQARKHARACYTLADNQRASEPLIEGLNALFGSNSRAFVQTGLHYHPVRYGQKPRAALIDHSEPIADAQAACAWRLWSLPGTDTHPGPHVTKQQARQLAKQACAGEIARLLDAGQKGQITIEGRPLSGRDIAVLVRTHAQGSHMRQALSALGVGSVELSQASVHDSLEALELERVLAAVHQASDEGLLRASLATTLRGWDAAAIHALADDETRLSALLEDQAQDAHRWAASGIAAMLRQWMERESVAQRLLQQADGERRLTNLLHLSERLQEATQTHSTPQALLHWLRAERTEGTSRQDDATQLRLASDRHLVQIVTIHKAKGLEYPVVFCPFLWDGSAGPSQSQEALATHDEAQRPVLQFGADRSREPLKSRLHLERVAENLRLTYVALTRASHRCYMVIGPYLSGPRASTSESSKSGLGWLVAGAGHEPKAWFEGKASPEDIHAGWTALARQQPGAMSLQPLPAGPARAVQLPQPAPESIRALTLPRPVAPPWWISSYSSLSHGARHEQAALDHDQREDEGSTDETRATEVLNTADATDATDILHFPRGPVAGECLHAVFERADFTNAGSWPGAIERALREHPLSPATTAHTSTDWSPTLMRLLADVLDTPLPLAGDFRLALLQPRQKLVELEFCLDVQGLRASTLQQLLGDHGLPAPVLSFAPLTGYLRGFIDLVFEHDQRYFIADWKSNHLGLTQAAYQQPGLLRAMTQHSYHLQALVYAVAVHRMLAQRLRGYQFEQHFGGVLYLFVRGMRPGWTQPDGRPCGVFELQPRRQLIEDLSGLFSGRLATSTTRTGVPA